MFRKLVLFILYLHYKISLCQEIDLNICPNGLTTSPPDSEWPEVIPNQFEIFSEISTDGETFQISQLFNGPYRESVHFRAKETDIRTYYDYDTNEMLVMNEQSECVRTSIASNEYLPFVVSEIIKPSVLLGFDGRTNYNTGFFTRFLGREIIRGGISTKKFQSCFYISQENITVNATYYLSETPPNQIATDSSLDFVQIDVQSNKYPYTFNIIRFISNPSNRVTTPAGVYCANRTNTKEFPKNLPSAVFLHSESFTLKTENTPSRIESFNRLIDETLEVELNDYRMSTNVRQTPPNRSIMDYLTNLNFMYTRETQQCQVLNGTGQSMGSTNGLLFQFGPSNNSIEYHYTGITDCGREPVQCHRWIGQRESGELIRQYEWYWSAKFNGVDLQEFIPIKVNIKTKHTTGPPKTTLEEIHIFNYNPKPNSMETIDSTLGQCYRALGPTRHYNYAILRMTLNNDKEYPVHQHLLSLRNQIHMQLANDLKIRHLRLSSFVIDTTRDTTDQQSKNVAVTFILLDNPPVAKDLIREPSSLELIRNLARQINDGKFFIRDSDAAFDLQAQPNSLQTLVLYLLPSENHTNYFNETVYEYENFTQTVIKQKQKVVYKHTGPQIAAFWMGFTLLGVIIAIAIGSFIAIRKWTPSVNSSTT